MNDFRLRLKMLFLVTLLFMGWGNMWAGSVTLTAGSDQNQGKTITKGGITVSFDQGSFDSNYYTCTGSSMTVSSTVGHMTNVRITCAFAETAGPDLFSLPGESTGNYSYSGIIGNWTGDAAEFTLRTTNNVSITSIEITYTDLDTPTHQVTWSVLGETTVEEYAEGATIDFPEAPADRGGKVFRGWTTTTIEGSQDQAPALVSTATMAGSDLTFYAVFATEEAGGGETTATYGFETESDADWTIVGPIRSYSNAKTGSYAGKIKTYTSYITFNHKVKVTEFSFAFIRTSTNNVQAIYIQTSTDSEHWTTVAQYPMNSFPNGTYSNESMRSHSFDGNTAYYVRFYCDNSTAVRYVDDVTIRYRQDGPTYTGYCTTMTPSPATATLTIAAACTNGNGTYYGTYSNGSYAFIVPEGLTVSEITVDDDYLTFMPYATGDIVPANTGVLVTASTPGEKTLSLTYATGSSLSDDNMLRGTGVTGLTAEEMTDRDADCEFFRLTMHNGTQLGFWWGAEDGAAFAITPNKAYLAVPAAVASSRIGFSLTDKGGIVTGIEKAESRRTGTVVYYTIGGQRVDRPGKGLYIIRPTHGDRVGTSRTINIR